MVVSDCGLPLKVWSLAKLSECGDSSSGEAPSLGKM